MDKSGYALVDAFIEQDSEADLELELQRHIGQPHPFVQSARHMASLTPEERPGLEAAGDALSRIPELADQAKDAAITVLRGELDRDTLIAQLGEMAERAAADEPPDLPWAQLAAYLQAVVALLREQPLPPVPPTFATHLAAIEAARHDRT